jgi:hypothetical protein
MSEYEIVTKYERLTSVIEDKFSGSEIPLEVQMYYLIASLISLQSFKRFYQRYGAIPIDVEFAEVGKIEWLNLGPLTTFESESAGLWNRYVKEINDNYKPKHLAPPGY